MHVSTLYKNDCYHRMMLLFKDCVRMYMCIYVQFMFLYLFAHTDRAPTHVYVNETQPTSVKLSWQRVEGANRYCVILAVTMGDHLCSDSHTISVITSSQSVVVGQTNQDMLRAYTTYSITVVAMSDVWSGGGESEPIIITTNQTSEDWYM